MSLAPRHPWRWAPGRPAQDVSPVPTRETEILFLRAPPGMPLRAQGIVGGCDFSPFARSFNAAARKPLPLPLVSFQ